MKLRIICQVIGVVLMTSCTSNKEPPPSLENPYDLGYVTSARSYPGFNYYPTRDSLNLKSKDR